MAITKQAFLGMKGGQTITDGHGRPWTLVQWLPKPIGSAEKSGRVRLGTMQRTFIYSWVDGKVNGVVNDDGQPDPDWNHPDARVNAFQERPAAPQPGSP